MLRTRVGYAGGTTPDPTYRTIGDHTETVQVDFDPAVISYDDLLDIFWTDHRPTGPPPSRQYASQVLYANEPQRESAESARARVEATVGPVNTRIAPLERFYVAEDYHQKYRLRNTPPLFREMRALYPDPVSFREATATARLNGYLYGYGTCDELMAEIDTLGLSESGRATLLGQICGSIRR